MTKKNYEFRLPEVQYLLTHHTAFGDTWMEGEKLPVYAFIPACSDSPSSTSTSGDVTPELECYAPANDPGEQGF